MVARRGAFLLPAIPLVLFACGGNERQGASAVPEDVSQEEPSLAETWGSPNLPTYDVVPVADGGTVTGTVRLSEAMAPRPDLPVLRNQVVCGEQRPDPSLVLGRDNGVANVVVSLVGIWRGKEMRPLPEPAQLNQRDCEFIPHIQVVPAGTVLVIANSDPLLHNVHAYLNETESFFNLAMPVEGYRIERSLDVPGIVSLKCDAGHTWMSAYIVVQEHPYYSLTTEDGTYSIEDVPAGDYRLKLWHELLGETEVAVEVEADATANVDLELLKQ